MRMMNSVTNISTATILSMTLTVCPKLEAAPSTFVFLTCRIAAREVR